MAYMDNVSGMTGLAPHAAFHAAQEKCRGKSADGPQKQQTPIWTTLLTGDR